MARFNSFVENKTENLAGGKAYKESPKLKLIFLLLTSFVQDKFYKTGNQELNNLKNIFNEIKDKKFIAKTSIFARTKFGMRSITHFLSALIAKKVKNEIWLKNYFEKIIDRVDDMTEILACYLNKYGKPIPNSVKKGFKKGFKKFDEYQLGKYKSEKKKVKLIDVVNLVRPIPTEKNENALKLLVEGKLKAKNTWELELTQVGQETNDEEEKKELKKKAWKRLVLDKKIGYFALLRNLRNILKQAPEIIDKAIELLTDEKLIKKSLILPFRFITAINEISKISNSQKIIIALNKALDISVNNVPKFKGETLVVLDTSGSMEGRPKDIGSLFSVILVKSNECDFMTFSNNAYYQILNPLDSTLTLAKSIHFKMGGTNFHSIFQNANRKYDRIIILSDMQGWIGYDTPIKAFNEYKNKYNCNPYVYSFDLNGYGTSQFAEKTIFCIAGFSEKIFDIMKLLEKDKNALINEIEKIEI